MSGAMVVATTAGAHKVGASVDGVEATAWAVARSIVEGGDDFFGSIIPTWVITKERSC